MRRWLSYYHPKMPVFLAYMLQQVEYSPAKFFKWVLTRPDLTKVMHRQKLVWTFKAYTLVVIISCIYGFYLVLSVVYFIASPLMGVLALLVTPVMVVLLTYLIVLAAWLYYEQPRRNKLIRQASKKFKKSQAVKIAILGSYGKTTMKEILATVLAEGKVVAATPGNRNVPVSHAVWSKKLSSKNQVLLIEYGEGSPGDIAKLAKMTYPDHAVITGLAPNHLDEYKSLDQLADDLLSIKEFVDAGKVYVNNASFSNRDITGLTQFSNHEVLGWKIKNVKVSYDGTSFVMQKKQLHLNVKSGLVGKHLVAPLALAAALADKLGLSKTEIQAGLAKTHPFEHRMQPRALNGAWIIDDTYNGSLEGIKAGLDLLTELPAKRKIYVTPGLVDQGAETERVHVEIGEKISQVQPDKLILMKNSATEFIVQGLEKNGYKGELVINDDPLAYYTQLEHTVAAGDLVMMQNDWTDNYR